MIHCPRQHICVMCHGQHALQPNECQFNQNLDKTKPQDLQRRQFTHLTTLSFGVPNRGELNSLLISNQLIMTTF